MRIEEKVHKALIAQKNLLALAESCTGGALSARLVAMPDASLYLLGSVVAYSDDWKEHFLGVPKTLLDRFGAVSREVVSLMLEGLFAKTSADYAVAVSGIAGPKGGTLEKPVGTVWIGVGKRGEPSAIEKIQAKGGRSEVIQETVDFALSRLLERVQDAR